MNCNKKPAVFPYNMFYTEVHHLNCKYQLMFYTPFLCEVKFISLWCETKSSFFLQTNISAIFISSVYVSRSSIKVTLNKRYNLRQVKNCEKSPDVVKKWFKVEMFK